MPTFDEKMKNFFGRFGAAAEEIAKGAEAVQKQADDSGVEHKEADADAAEVASEDTTTKAKKPAAEAETEQAKLEIEVEEEPETEDDEEEEGEEEEKELDSDFFALGDVDLKEYGDMMGDVLLAAVEPILEEITALKEMLHDALGTTKERQEAGLTIALEAAKDHETRLEKLERENAQLKKAIQKSEATIKELRSDTPRIMDGFVASQSKETELDDDDPRLKEGPSADPIGNFVDTFILTGVK